MSADTSGDVSHVQDEDVLRKMWQDTEDFGKKKEIRSHMYKLREERLRNFYSSADPSTDIQRAQSSPGLHDKPAKEGNGPTHADSLADHSFLSLKSKEIRDSESPTREMHYRVDKTRGADQGWNVVTKNESSPDGKTHSTSRVATTSGTENIDGGVANYAAKCEQKSSVFNDGDDKNFTKSMATSSKNLIQQEAKGGDDNSNFQSFSTSSSSSSNVVSQHRSTGGDTTDFKALPSNVDDSSSTVIRKTYTTNVPAELKNSPNYIDANTKVTTETRTLPDGSRVTTTRYETRGGKSVSTSSTDHHATTSKQVASEQKSSTVKSTSSKTETQSSNRTIQDSRNVHDDVNKTRIINQDNTQIVRQVPVNFGNTDRTVSVQVIKSTNDDVNQNVSQSVSKTSSSSVNIQKSHQVIDSRNVDVNIERDRIVQTKDFHDTKRDTVKKVQDVERNVDVRQEFITTKDNVVKTHTSQDVHGTHQDDVRNIRIIQENEYLPRDNQPDFARTPKDNRTTSTTVRQEVVTTKDGTVKKTTTQDVRGGTHDDVRIIKTVHETGYSPKDTQPEFDRIPKDQQTSTTTVRKEVTTRGDTTRDVRGSTHDDVRITRVIQEKENRPRDTQPDFGRTPIDQQPSGHQEIVTTRREVITTNKSENIPTTAQDDVHIMRVIQENEYLPRGKQPGGPGDRRIPDDHIPGDGTPVPSTPGDRTPVGRTPGDRTPIGRAPGDRPPAVLEIVCHLVPQQERPDQFIPKGHQPPDTHESHTTKTTTTTVTTNIDNKTGDRNLVSDDFINKERTHIIHETKPGQKEPSPKYEKPKPGQKEPSPKYDTPEKREPIKPGKSELDEKPTPTDGQYQTTYRTDYVNRRISVEVSPTHDAFARSLRAISPDRDKKRGSTRSLKSSTSSLRSSTSPEKYPTDRRQPGRVSPDRKPGTGPRETSPTKRTSPDKFTPGTCSPRRSPTKQTPHYSVNTDSSTRRRKDETYTTVSKSSPERKPVKPGTTNYDTITRTKHTFANDSRHVTKTDTKESIDSSTLTRRPKDQPRSRSTSPTSIASDIEFVKSSELITDLDDETITSTTNRTNARRDVIETQRTVIDDALTDKRPTSLNVTTTTTTKKTRKITDRSPTSPLTDFSPTKKSPAKDKPQDKPFKRRDTYEDRCRQILGIADTTTIDKNVTELKKTTRTKVEDTSRTAPRKPSTDGYPRSSSKSPEKIRSPTKDIQEFPSQIRRSPEKQPLEKIPRKTSPTKDAPKIQEFPSQIRRSPEKQPLQKPSEKCRPSKEKPKVQEFPSQVRRSPEKQPLEKPSERPRPASYVTKVQEFPSQIRRSPEKQALERPTEKPRPTKEGPKVQEFPSQIRRSPEKQPLEKYPEKVRPTKERPTVDEYPSQFKKVPGLGKAPGEADEPLFTKRFISTLCRDEEVERTDAHKTTTQRGSPERTLPQDYVTPSDTDSDRPHKTVKKDSPEKEYPIQRGPSPERKQPVTTKFIDTERTDTDIRITEYEKESRRPSKPTRASPERRPVTERYDNDKRTTTTDVTEYTDEYCTPEGYKPFKPDRKSPTRTPLGSEEKPKRPTQPGRVSPDRKSVTERYNIDKRTSTEYSTIDTEQRRPVKPDRKSPTRSHPPRQVIEYTDEDQTPGEDNRRPTKPQRSSPSRSPVGSESTRRTKTTEYTDEYGTVITYDDDEPKQRTTDRRPDRKSPERIRGVTEYTDEYRGTDKREKTTTDRVTKITAKSTRPTGKPTKPGDDEETTDSEIDSTTRRRTDNYTIKETTITIPNGNAPKRTTSPSKPVKSGITEYPSQKPKPGKTTPKTTKATIIITRRDKKDEKVTQHDTENVYNVEVDEKFHTRTHRMDDYYTNKTTKTLTNGDVPKTRTIPKRNEPKPTKSGITEYPSQKSPERRRPLTDRPKPAKETPERKIPKRPDTTRIVCSPYDKPRSPDRYSPSKQVTDKDRTHTTTVTRKIATKNIETYETRPKAKTPTKSTQRQPEQPSTKRHVVTATIQVSPKGPRRPLQKTTVAHTTIEKTSRLSQPRTITERTKPRKPTQNGRVTTEEDSETDYEVVDEEIIDKRRVTEDTSRISRRTDSKITRTTSDQIIKTPQRIPVRGQSKPELLTYKPTRPGDAERTTTKSGKKVITTKSITINNDFDDEKEIIVNLQRSTSSREPTPDRIYPRPASEDEDSGIPRYPDQISEPDEPRTRRRPTKLSDIPIIESEDTQQFTRITEHDGIETRRINKVEKTDECLLSVNQKVSKFVDEAEKLTKKQQKPLSPTRKSPRPDIVVAETTETDQSHRTVTEKLSKFANTTDQLTTQQRIPERPKSPKCKNYPDDEVDDQQFTSVSKKVSHFIETAEKVKHPQKPGLKDGPVPRVTRPDFTDVDESIKTDDCLLSVSDKVSKFTTVHKLQSPDYKKPVSLAKIDITPKRQSPTREFPGRESPRRESPRRESPLRESPRRESPRREIPRKESPRRESPSGITTECVQIDSEEQTYIRRPSPDRYSPGRREGSPRPYPDEKTPTRPFNRQTTVTKTDVQQSKYVRKDSSITEPDSTPKSSRKDDEPRSVLSPTGRIRSTESIRKAKELFENIAKEQTTTKQRDIIGRPSVFEGRKPKQPDDDRCTIRTTKNEDVKLTDIGVYNIRTSDNKIRNISSKLRYSSDEDIETTDTTRKTITSTYNKDDHLKSTRLIMDKLHRPRSPEKDGDVPGYLRPLDRSPRPHSPYNDRSRSPKPDSESPSRDRSPRPHDPNLDEIPHYMWPLDRNLRDGSSERDRSRSRSGSREPTPDLHGRLRSRGSTPDRNVPGYMKPLDRHVHTSPHRKSTNELEGIPKKHPVDDTDRPTKFGVTLRRTDSGRAVTTTTSTSTTSQKRKLTAVEIERILTTQEIEEIYEIEILEILLERAVNYEQRRRIRSQIRIVKQLIADNKLSIVTSKKTLKTASPTRDYPKTRGKSPDKPIDRRPDKSRTEYQTEYVRKVSPSRKTVDNKHYQHTDVITKRSDVERKSEYQSSYAYNERRTSSEVKTHVRGSSPESKIFRGKSPEKAPRKSITTVETITRHSPERKTEKIESRGVYKTELRRTTPVTKTVVEEKPSWITQRSLKKPSEAVSSRKTSSTNTTRKQTTSRTSPTKERKPIDVITSSYGVGPTDENGTPLFGLRALRAQNRTDTTKVQGTVIRSHYYSENGQEPTGEVSVTKYSTDPRDLDGNVEERNGLVSVTTTQKFGTKGTPSYKTITDKKQVTDLDDEECETVTRKSTTTKVSRRGSVKEMSKKFVENAVETSKNERQSSYPKAGLILRTSSFKDTAKSGTGSSRESSPEKHESVGKTVTVKKTTASSSSRGRADTFLNNKTRVHGVQDVITRMKNSEDDVQAGDSPEDQEARTLLNKFIGSQVILSGMETRTSSSSSPSTTTVKRTTTTTSSTSKGGGKPTVITRTFTHPITEEDVATVWDEQTLKLLLERSTDYEERQIIRYRIREVMAEQEVCADIVAKSKEESSGRVEETVETSKKTSTESPVTTTQVTTRVTSQQQVAKKPISPFAKFRQLDKQNSINTPPGTPRTPTGSRPLFKFTDPELSRQASTVKERLLQWCQMKTKEYENVQLDNFSSSWADGLAFCALIHHFLPDAFDYQALTPKERRHNFTLAFRIADEKADILPLLDVDDMVATRKPDWKCVFTYVQTIYAHFKNED